MIFLCRQRDFAKIYVDIKIFYKNSIFANINTVISILIYCYSLTIIAFFLY